jgi:membrane protease YdiL (CAAX protease family)
MLAALATLYSGDLLRALAERWPLFFTQFPLGVLAIAVVTGLAEEPGWRGYAQPAANRRFQPLLAALVVSVIWATWHLPNALFGPGVRVDLRCLDGGCRGCDPRAAWTPV